MLHLNLGTKQPDKTCSHCGKTLKQVVHTSTLGNCYTPWHEECDCPDAETDRQAKCQATAHRKAQELKAASGIPARYLEKRFENYHIPPGYKRLYTTATAYAERFKDIKDGMGLYITGSCGIGKTHIATAVALHLMDKGHQVICKPSIDILADIRRTYVSGTEQSEFELLGVYLKTELLVIDDLGKESVTDWSLSMLYTLINMRYSNMKPMLVTTNYTDEQLIQRLGRKGDMITAEAIVSRLHEACHTVEVSGGDYRKRK